MSGLWRLRRFWVALLIGSVAILGYGLIPRRADIWLQIRVRNQQWDELKEVQLSISDRSGLVVPAATLALSTAYDNGVRQLSGITGWDTDVAEQIVAASNNGLMVAISSPHCRPVEFEMRRNDISRSYDLPSVQLGGHGNGFRVAAMHYRFSRSLDLECEFASRP